MPAKSIVNPYEHSEVVNVEFLVPVRVTWKNNGLETTEVLSIDIVNKRLYTLSGKNHESPDKVFRFINQVNELPEDFFAVPDTVSELVEEMESDRDNILNMGKNNE